MGGFKAEAENPFRSSNHPSERMHSSASPLSIFRLFFSTNTSGKLSRRQMMIFQSHSSMHHIFLHFFIPRSSGTLNPFEQILQLNYVNFSQNINFISQTRDEGRSVVVEAKDMWLISRTAELHVSVTIKEQRGRCAAKCDRARTIKGSELTRVIEKVKLW